MSNQPRKIDLASSTMKRIDEQGIAIRPRRYFTVRKFMAIFSLTVLMLLSILLVASLVYSFKFDTFSDYLGFDNGTILYIKSLPWAGIALSLGVIGLSIYTARKAKKYAPQIQVNQVIASVAVFALIFTFFGNFGNPSQTPKVFSLVNSLTQDDPIKVLGTVDKDENEYIYIKTDDNYYKVQKSELTKDFEKGDEVLILGKENNGILIIKASKILKQAPKEAVKKEIPKLQKKVEEVKTEPEPKPEPVVTTPTPTPEPEPEPEPAVEQDAITITGTSKKSDKKYLVTWSSNFKLKKGFKLVWSKSPNPVYPGDQYYFDGTAASSGSGYVKKTDGSGTYYVRVCEYTGGGCDVYSSQVTVTFP